MKEEITIEYCLPCQFEHPAQQLAESIRASFHTSIGPITLVPTRMMGNFEGSLPGETIYSKQAKGRLPHPGEIEQILIQKGYK